MKIAFTVCSANYLPFAKSLADSFIQYNPGYQFYIIVVDPEINYDPQFYKPHSLLPLPELPIAHFEEMNSKYNIFELTCALTPCLAEYLLNVNKDCEVIFYLDSDILVFGSFTEAETILKQHSFVYTPHHVSPNPHPALVESELNVLKAGIYNSGFWGLSRCDQAFELLAWWKDRLKDYCYNTPEKGVFVDQIWLNFIPVYFSDSYILNNPGYNVAYWNLHERKLTFENGQYIVNGKYQLIFFHFSGYDIRQPQVLSKWQTVFTFKDIPEYKPLFEKYMNSALNNNRDHLMDLIPGFGIKVPVKEKPTVLQRFRRFFGR